MMKFGVLPALFLSLAFAACAQPAPVDMHAAVDAQLHANARSHGIPAQSVLVLHNGEILYRNATGTTAIGGGTPVTPKTAFPLFSVSKLFANTVAMQLVEEGKLDLVAPASRYVPNLPLSWRHNRVEQFLSHISGVPEYFDGNDLARPFPPSLEAVFAKLTDVPPVSPPGERTHYTQTNYLVIEAILEAVTHIPYRTLVTQRIIEPLGLHQTWLDAADAPKDRLVESYHAEKGRAVREQPIAWPDYAIVHTGIHATLDDMGKFLSAVAQGRLVSKMGLLRFWQPYHFANGSDGYFASGWDFGESGRWHEVGHDGGTKVRVRILFGENLDDYYIIIYLTNGNNDNVWSRTLVDSVQQLILPK
jgi:CubicO group peptidase (beta-lactamase class C family)